MGIEIQHQIHTTTLKLDSMLNSVSVLLQLFIDSAWN